jgi:hypothetical protein
MSVFVRRDDASKIRKIGSLAYLMYIMMVTKIERIEYTIYIDKHIYIYSMIY